jgi:Tfp pilus assembly pilus retraction ATPase PilT
MPPGSALALENVLRVAIEMNATNIHVQVGLPPMFRVRGKLMLTMENSLKGLVDKGWISADDALESCFDPKEMARILGRK